MSSTTPNIWAWVAARQIPPGLTATIFGSLAFGDGRKADVLFIPGWRTTMGIHYSWLNVHHYMLLKLIIMPISSCRFLTCLFVVIYVFDGWLVDQYVSYIITTYQIWFFVIVCLVTVGKSCNQTRLPASSSQNNQPKGCSLLYVVLTVHHYTPLGSTMGLLALQRAQQLLTPVGSSRRHLRSTWRNEVPHERLWCFTWIGGL